MRVIGEYKLIFLAIVLLSLREAHQLVKITFSTLQSWEWIAIT